MSWSTSFDVDVLRDDVERLDAENLRLHEEIDRLRDRLADISSRYQQLLADMETEQPSREPQYSYSADDRPF